MVHYFVEQCGYEEISLKYSLKQSKLSGMIKIKLDYG